MNISEKTMMYEAKKIVYDSIQENMPGRVVREAVSKIEFSDGKIISVSVGKAAWEMSNAAFDYLGERISKGIVITKYGHSKGKIPKHLIFEAGHPIPDENSFIATEEAIRIVEGLDSNDNVLFLLSGGGSALLEKPLIDSNELADISEQLLASGASIVEINTIRKRLSDVKGGKFARKCEPAHVYNIVLSDIIGDPLDMIASGPAYPDSSTSSEACNIIEKYGLILSPFAQEMINKETVKKLNNVTTYVMGSVKQLCKSAINAAVELGYSPLFLTDSLSCEAKEAGKIIGQIAKAHQDDGASLAFIMGGETTVHIKGNGKGGRNQELALAAAKEIEGLKNTLIISVGSDGTDGPTDAAGGVVNGETALKLKNKGIIIDKMLDNNDSYNALKACEGLIKTGPTGTNVNDLTVLLIKR